MDKDELLRELLNLKSAKILEEHKMGLDSLHGRLMDDARLSRNPFARHYMKHGLAKLDYDSWDYGCRIREYLNACGKLQDMLPAGLSSCWKYIDYAIDDIMMGRAETVEDIVKLFYERLEKYEAMRSTSWKKLDYML